MVWDMQNTTLKNKKCRNKFRLEHKTKAWVGIRRTPHKKFKVVKLILFDTQNKKMSWDMQNTTPKNTKCLN